MRADPGSLASPLRVLFVHNRYQQAGGEDSVFEAEAHLLESRGHEVDRLVVDNDAIPERLTLSDRVRLASQTIWSREGVRLVRRAVRTFRPSVVHAHNTFPLLSPAIHAAAHEAGAATVQTLHNYRLICPSANLYRDRHPCQDCVGRRIAWPAVAHACYRGSRSATAAVAAMLGFHRARRTWSRDIDVLIALTGFARDRLVAGGLPADRVAVRPNFLDLEPAGASGPGNGFLFVGRLTEDKGVDTLLDAWARMPDGAELRIAGSGPLEDRVRSSAAGQRAVRYLGQLPRPQVLAEMLRSRAVIVPSHWYEAFPLTVLEAFACARPVIASDHGSLAEIVTDRTGLLTRPADPLDLADKADWAERHPREMENRGLAARSEFSQRFTSDRGYEGLVAIYRRAMAAFARRQAR